MFFDIKNELENELLKFFETFIPQFSSSVFILNNLSSRNFLDNFDFSYFLRKGIKFDISHN